jgi:trehalose-phosphatase
MLSGRSAHEVAPLLGVEPPPETWGTNGVERLFPDGRYEGPEVSDEVLQVFEDAEADLEKENLGELVEVRPAAVAVHWRGLSPAETLAVRTRAYRILEPLVFQPGLLLAEFDGGVEIRLRSASKGDVVHTVLAETAPSVPVAYLGDDTSDEDAFRALNGRGVTILVNRKHVFTAAQYWLRPPEDLIHFFEDWIRACSH